MLLIVFGAGASYDSVRSRRDLGNFTIYSYPFRPPLADQLFDNRGYFNEVLNLYPEARPIAQRLRDLPDDASLEQRLSGYLKESEGYEPLRRQLTAVRFYLQRVLWECGRMWGEQTSWTTNYLGLLHQVDRFWRYGREREVCIVNFNYDFMADKALEAVIERPLGSLDEYIRGPYWLIKPHGSVNWARRIKGPVEYGQEGIDHAIISRIDELDVTPEFVLIQGPTAGSSQEPLLPALAIPVQIKASFELPDAHRAALTRLVPKVTHLLVVGWRGTEPSFLDIFRKAKKRPKHKLVVSGGLESAQTVGENLSALGAFDYSASTFSDFIQTDELRDFLNRGA